MTKILAAHLLMIIAGCSAAMITRPVSDDRTAKGLRYLKSENVEMQVYLIKAGQKGGSDVIRLGDAITTSIPDPSQLFEVTFRGALFTSQTLNVKMSDNGRIKQISLDAKGSPAAGAITGVRAVTETVRDFDKTRQQAEIDNLNREINLIKARKALEDALK